jgi:Holliday junction resolvase RusA-like endonuclease
MEGTRIEKAGKLTIRLPIAAIGKPRMTQRDKWAKRPCVERFHSWCDALRAVAGKVPPPESVLSLSWLAVFAMPESWSRKRKEASLGKLHRSKPDRDNIDKGILDCLYKSDSGIARGHIEKRWGTSSSLTIAIRFEEKPNGGR